MGLAGEIHAEGVTTLRGQVLKQGQDFLFQPVIEFGAALAENLGRPGALLSPAPAAGIGGLGFEKAFREITEQREALLESREEVNDAIVALEEKFEAELARREEARARAEGAAARTAARTAAQARRQSLTKYRTATRRIQQNSNLLDRLLKDRARKLQAATKSIDDAMLRLLDPFERERVELRRWANDTLAVLRGNAAAYEQYADRVREALAGGMADIAERELEDRQRALERLLRFSRQGAHGLARGLQDYAREATDAARHIELAVQGAFRNIEDELTRLLTRGKFSFRRFLRDLAEDAARAVIRIGITGPVASRLGAAVRGRLGLPAPIGAADVAAAIKDLDRTAAQTLMAQEATADKVDEVAAAARDELIELQQQTELLRRIADCACRPPEPRFDAAAQFRADGGGGLARRLLDAALGAAAGIPRFHAGGVVPGAAGQEVLAALEGGETVLTRRGAAALARGGDAPPRQVQVVVENRGANQQEVVEQRAAFNGQDLVIQIVTDDVGKNGPFSQQLRRAFNLAPRTG